MDSADMVLEAAGPERRHNNGVEAQLDAIADVMNHHCCDGGILEVVARPILLRSAIAMVPLVQPSPAVHVVHERIQQQGIEGILVAIALARQSIEPTNAAHAAPRVANVPWVVSSLP